MGVQTTENEYEKSDVDVEDSISNVSTPVNTPTKRKKLQVLDPSSKMAPVKNIPSKGKKEKINKDISISKINRCKVCDIIYQSKEDKALKTVHGIKNEFMGCKIKNCEYWVHVRCTDHVIKRKKDIEKIEFYCPEHERSKCIVDKDMSNEKNK